MCSAIKFYYTFMCLSSFLTQNCVILFKRYAYVKFWRSFKTTKNFKRIKSKSIGTKDRYITTKFKPLGK